MRILVLLSVNLRLEFWIECTCTLKKCKLSQRFRLKVSLYCESLEYILVEAEFYNNTIKFIWKMKNSSLVSIDFVMESAFKMRFWILSNLYTTHHKTSHHTGIIQCFIEINIKQYTLAIPCFSQFVFSFFGVTNDLCIFKIMIDTRHHFHEKMS